MSEFGAGIEDIGGSGRPYGRPEIFGDLRRSSETGPRRERQKLKRQQQNGEAPAMDLSRPAMMEQSNTDSWQVGGRFSRAFQSEPCRSELNHQCLRENMEKHEKI